MLYKGKIIISISAISSFLFLIFVSSGFRLNKISALSEIKYPIIVIDPGHGGFDPGAIRGTVKEKDINICIAKKLYTYLLSFGYTSVMTRTDDSATGTTKTDDLQKRVDITFENNDTVLISVHQNMFSDGKYSGAQMFYGVGDGSESLAEHLKNAVVQNIQPENKRECKSGEKLYILSKTKCPSVMVECGFMSNAEELRRLTDDSYQNKLAFSIAKGIQNYMTEEYQNVRN